MVVSLRVAPHPSLELGVFVTRLPRSLVDVPAPAEVRALAQPGARAPLAPSDAVRASVRALLRHGGFKPAGRSKPASEYLAAAVADSRFPEINALVDLCNVVSLHSGLPISVIDLDRSEGELAIEIAPPGTTYVFNPSGQTIDASGLLCVVDALGPTGTPVKDAQRTKTHDDTRTALAVVWGTHALPGHTAAATRWYRELTGLLEGVVIEDVVLT